MKEHTNTNYEIERARIACRELQGALKLPHDVGVEHLVRRIIERELANYRDVLLRELVNPLWCAKRGARVRAKKTLYMYPGPDGGAPDAETLLQHPDAATVIAQAGGCGTIMEAGLTPRIRFDSTDLDAICGDEDVELI